MLDPTGRSFDDRADDVLKVGGATALGITVLTAGGGNAVLQALVVWLSGGGPPGLDAEGLTVIVNAFILTAPLAITVGLVGFAYARMGLADQSGETILVAVAAAVVAGIVLGSIVYTAFLGWVLEIDIEDFVRTVGRQGGSWQARVGAGILWFVVGYYELYGPQYFVAAIAAGLFPAFAAHWLLPIEHRAA